MESESNFNYRFATLNDAIVEHSWYADNTDVIKNEHYNHH